MEKLINYLYERNIRFKTSSEWPVTPGVPSQVIVYDDNDVQLFDAVCHKFSYGSNEGLLETMGLCEDENDVKGWQTADNVIEDFETAVHTRFFPKMAGIKEKLEQKNISSEQSVPKDFLKLIEMRSMYRRAYEIHEENTSEHAPAESWETYRDKIGVNDMSYDNLKETLSEFMLSNDINYTKFQDAYWSKANPNNNTSVQSEALDELHESIKSMAFDEALNGNWNTTNDQYLSDAQRNTIMIKEELEAQNRELGEDMNAGEYYWPDV